MKVLIMAAGRGQRFRAGGFEIPKPLIRYNDMPMIEWAIREFPHIPRNDIIIVGIPEVCHYVKGSHPEIRTVSVEHTQNGPAMSALLAGGLIKNDESFIMVDCDIILAKSHAQQFALDLAADSRIEGALIYTEITGPTNAYCNVKLEHEFSTITRLGNVIDGLEEKTGNSDAIAVGIYGFKTWSFFRSRVIHIAEFHEGEEIYLSWVLDDMVELGCDVRGTCVPSEDWTCLGTPKEFEEASK